MAHPYLDFSGLHHVNAPFCPRAQNIGIKNSPHWHRHLPLPRGSARLGEACKVQQRSSAKGSKLVQPDTLLARHMSLLLVRANARRWKPLSDWSRGCLSAASHHVRWWVLPSCDCLEVLPKWWCTRMPYKWICAPFSWPYLCPIFAAFPGLR